MDLPELERRLQEAVALYPPAVRVQMLRVLSLADDARARRIGELYADNRTRSLAEVLIDFEQDSAARAAITGMLREGWGTEE
jgi:hypothetical protein